MINFLPDAGSKTIGADQPFKTSATQVTSGAEPMGAPAPSGEKSADAKAFSSIFQTVEGQTAETSGQGDARPQAGPQSSLNSATGLSSVLERSVETLSYASPTEPPATVPGDLVGERPEADGEVNLSGTLPLSVTIASDEASDNFIVDSLDLAENSLPGADSAPVPVAGVVESLSAPETVTRPDGQAGVKDRIVPIGRVEPDMSAEIGEPALQLDSDIGPEDLNLERSVGSTAPETVTDGEDARPALPLSETVRAEADLRAPVETRPIPGSGQDTHILSAQTLAAPEMVGTDAQTDASPVKLRLLDRLIPLAANDGTHGADGAINRVELADLSARSASNSPLTAPLDGEGAELAAALPKAAIDKVTAPTQEAAVSAPRPENRLALEQIGAPQTGAAHTEAPVGRVNTAINTVLATPTDTSDHAPILGSGLPEKAEMTRADMRHALSASTAAPFDSASLAASASSVTSAATPVLTSMPAPASTPVMPTPLTPSANAPVTPFILPTVQVATLTQLPQTIVATTLSKQRAMIQIDPPELGRIQIDYAFESGQRTRVMLVPETEAARAAMTDRLPSLIALFETHHNGAVDVEIQSSERFDSEFKQDSLFSQSDSDGTHKDGETDSAARTGPVNEGGAQRFADATADNLPRLDGRNGNRLHLRI